MVTETNTTTALAPIAGLIIREEGGEDAKGTGKQPGEDKQAKFKLEKPYAVPSDEAFGGEEFANAKDLRDLADDLIEAFHKDFWHLDNTSITYLWRRKAAMSMGKMQYGQCQRTPPIAKMWCKTEFIVWLSADTCRKMPATYEQVAAMLYHELLHIGWNDAGKEPHCVVRGHDFEGFRREVEVFGFHQADIEEMAGSFQMRFAMDSAESEG